jgi:hypothetical protein
MDKFAFPQFLTLRPYEIKSWMNIQVQFGNQQPQRGQMKLDEHFFPASFSFNAATGGL